MKRRKMLKLALTSVAASLALVTALAEHAARAEGAPLTTDGWGSAVGFKPDLSVLKVPAGTMIHKGNVEQVKDLLAPGLELLVKKYELKLNISDYQPYFPSEAYIKATQQNAGKSKAWDVGKDIRKAGFSGYVSGLPFPKPKDGLQVAYNFLNTYGGDDADRHYDVTWISAKNGVETSEYWHWQSIRLANRTDLDPKPLIPEFEKDRYRGAALTTALEPYDKQGFGALYFTSLDPVDLTGHVYVPAMRRVLRQTFGTRGDSWNATDYLFEDVGGYLGAAEWMNWKILAQKTMLLPANAGAKYGKDPKAVFEIDKWPHWNPKVNWQARPVYVLEVKPKIPDYPYSRMLMLVDAETYVVLYKEAFDKKGELWKIILSGGNFSTDPKHAPSLPGFGLALDLQSQHATLITFRKVTLNSKLNPEKFSVATLKASGH
jgi:Protein of unknown function (DUF1329)